MDLKIKKALEILGFEESAKVGKLPKMKDVKKKFHKLALTHHPDKPGGNGEVFKEMTEAYRLIGEYILEEQEENEDDENGVFDFEEEVARKTFKQFQFANVKENMRSFTIHIDNAMSCAWTTVLSQHYGVPLDKNTNGLHWRVSNYSDGHLTGNITIGKWHIPKKDKQSKLLIQSTEKGNFLPAHYVDHVLPKLFEEVKATHVPELKEPVKESGSSKEIKTSTNGFKCKECDFLGRSINGVATHMRKSHKKVNSVTTNLNIKDDTISMEDFASKFNIKDPVAEKVDTTINTTKMSGKQVSGEAEIKDALDMNTNKTIEDKGEAKISDAMNKNEKTDLSEEKTEDESKGNKVIPDKKEKPAEGEQMEVLGPNKSNQDEKLVKKKIRGNDFACKHCSQKFNKVTQLTSHLKSCHTKVDDIETGNAITVNSPLVTVKHFFCHCSICGSGYNDYVELSSHENEQHNHKCEECDDCFMVESCEKQS